MLVVLESSKNDQIGALCQLTYIDLREVIVPVEGVQKVVFTLQHI
jgi:hypothetical protein